MGSAQAANSPSLKALRDSRPKRSGSERRDRPGAVDRRRRRTTAAGEGRTRRRLARRKSRRNRLPPHRRPRRDRARPMRSPRGSRSAMRARLTRRDQARRRGHRLDLRRTIHRNISHGGVPIEPRQAPAQGKAAAPRHPARRLRLDEPLHGVFLRFIHGVVDAFREAEAFVFHTRLAHVSDALHERDATRALDRLSLMAQGIGGGTRIGESLATFNRWHARARHPFAHLRDDRLRRLRHRRAGTARRARWRRLRGAAAASSGSIR